MRHLKALGVALIALFALALTATSAFATLPDLSIQLVGLYPLHMQFNDNSETPTRLNDTGGNKLEGKGTLILLLQSELSALGLFEALFLKVLFKGKLCEQTGEKNTGEILTEGTYHVVYPSLTPLTLGIAFLVKEVSFLCNEKKVKVKVRGCALAGVTDPKTASEDVQLATGTLLGNGSGVNNLTEYDNAAGTEKVKCILEANFGTGFLQAEETVVGEVHLEVLENKMFSISPI